MVTMKVLWSVLCKLMDVPLWGKYSFITSTCFLRPFILPLVTLPLETRVGYEREIRELIVTVLE